MRSFRVFIVFYFSPHVQSLSFTQSSCSYLREDRWEPEDHLAASFTTTGWKVEGVSEKDRKLLTLKKKKIIIICMRWVGLVLRICNLTASGFIFPLSTPPALSSPLLSSSPFPAPHATSHTMFPLGRIWLIGAWFVVGRLLFNAGLRSYFCSAAWYPQNPLLREHPSRSGFSPLWLGLPFVRGQQKHVTCVLSGGVSHWIA